MNVCRVCGIECRAEDETVFVNWVRIHVACAVAPTVPKRRRIGRWAAMGSGGQMALGAVQRDTTF